MLEQEDEILGGDATLWMADAACAEHANNADVWFDKAGVTAAKRVCQGCLVQRECLAYAITEDMVEGTWGGATADERKQLVASGRLTGDLIRKWGRHAIEGWRIERWDEFERERCEELGTAG